MKINYPVSNFSSIAEIHPLAPIFAYKINNSKSGMNHHIQLLTYDHHSQTIVDVSEVIAKNLDKRVTNGGVSIHGTGMSMTTFLIDQFKEKYEQLTSQPFLGKLSKNTKDEKKWLLEDVAKFLNLKEKKLKFATKEEQNNVKFVYECVKTCGCSVEHASSRLKNNKKIAIAALLDDPVSLRYLGDKIKDDENYVLFAVNKYQNGHLWASSRIIEAIGDNDPKAYLNSVILNAKLENEIKDKDIQSKKHKI